jgi:hypothetical protein
MGMSIKLSPDLIPDNAICLDFEASAQIQAGDDRSYPIEVGIAYVHSGECRSWLIRPTEKWLTEGLWTSEAEKIHNIPQDLLMREGLPVEQVATELAAAVNGARVFSDAPSYDGAWLKTLYMAVDITKPLFGLEDFHAFAWELAYRSGRRPDIAVVNSELEAQTRFPQQHRAVPDARRNAEILRLIAGWP